MMFNREVNPADQFPNAPLGQLHIHLTFLLKFNITFSTDHMNLFGGPDNGSATGTNILPGTDPPLAGTLQA